MLRRMSEFLSSRLLVLMTMNVILTMNCAMDENMSCLQPSVIIPQGRLEGEIMKTRHNRNVYSFRSIPYAEPPIGNLRFKEPQAARPWAGTLSATRESNVCPQLSNGVFIGNEDCLHLNVYTPQLPVQKKSTLLPVMVYFHGSGFEISNGGSALYGPRFLLDEDVVLVTLNYRLGPLGFLSTGDDVVPGNNGLKDQVLALRWVQTNIRHFGGDPQRVTIFGQSTGGCSVHLLALSNTTRGLFHQYIMQSGSAFSIRGYRPSNIYKNRASELGGYLGCPTNTSVDLVSCLRRLNVTEIIETRPLFNVWKNFPDKIWGPTDEPDFEGAFLTDSPENLYAAGKISHLPSMIGDVRSSGFLLSGDFYTNPSKFDDFLAQFDYALPNVLQYGQYVDNVTARTDALKAYYFNNDLTANRSALLSNFTEMISDSFYIFPIYKTVQQQLELAKNADYFYFFEYRGTFSHSYVWTNGSTANYGAVHNDDCLYLFSETEQRFGVPDTEMSANDFEIVDAMVQLWTSFAINGRPSALALNGTSTWTQYSSLDNYLQIGRNSDVTLSMEYSFLPQRMKFWKELTARQATE